MYLYRFNSPGTAVSHLYCHYTVQKRSVWAWGLMKKGKDLSKATQKMNGKALKKAKWPEPLSSHSTWILQWNAVWEQSFISQVTSSKTFTGSFGGSAAWPAHSRLTSLGDQQVRCWTVSGMACFWQVSIPCLAPGIAHRAHQTLRTFPWFGLEADIGFLFFGFLCCWGFFPFWEEGGRTRCSAVSQRSK